MASGLGSWHYYCYIQVFNGDETAISRYFNKSKEERGYKALTDSMVALASGESKNAINNATRAERLLKRPQLTNLINAQVAEAFGDNKRAFKYYKRLLDNDQTRFIGVQGLLNQKLIEEDTETALLLAKSFSLRPNHDHTLNVLFDLQTGGEDWKGAQKPFRLMCVQEDYPRMLVAAERQFYLLLMQGKCLKLVILILVRKRR